MAAHPKAFACNYSKTSMKGPEVAGALHIDLNSISIPEKGGRVSLASVFPTEIMNVLDDPDAFTLPDDLIPDDTTFGCSKIRTKDWEKLATRMVNSGVATLLSPDLRVRIRGRVFRSKLFAVAKRAASNVLSMTVGPRMPPSVLSFGCYS